MHNSFYNNLYVSIYSCKSTVNNRIDCILNIFYVYYDEEKETVEQDISNTTD